MIVCGASMVASGVLVDPQRVTFSVRSNLGGVIASAAYPDVASVVHVATGIFEYWVPIPIAASSIGNWTYGFRATGGFQGATPDTTFEITPTTL